jgi:nicotinate-nucleotide adenylyltransferase
VLDMHEIERGGTTYTIDTLRELRAGPWRDAALVLIMGSDQFERFDTWRDWQAIGDLAHLAVAQRAGRAARPGPALEAWAKARHCGPAELAHRRAGSVVEFPMTAVDASATEARRLLAEQSPEAERRLARLLPSTVLDYIRAHRLYH